MKYSVHIVYYSFNCPQRAETYGILVLVYVQNKNTCSGTSIQQWAQYFRTVEYYLTS